MYEFWLILVAVAVITTVSRALVARRRELNALRNFAADERLNFSPEDLIGVHDRYHNLDLIRQGHHRHACNLIYGSTRAGLVTLFNYTCERGFGVNHTTQRWWFVVLETTHLQNHWLASPADETAPPAGAAPIDVTRINRFKIRSDQKATAESLARIGLETVLKTASPHTHIEARGPLLAVATPLDTDPKTPASLLTFATQLVNTLAESICNTPSTTR